MSEGYENLDYEDFDEDPYGKNYEESGSLENNILEEPPLLQKKGSIVFLTISDIKKVIDKKCKDITELLGLPEDESILLYNHFKWRKDLVEGEYFGNEDEVRKQAGMDPQEVAAAVTEDQITCPLCFDTKPKEQFEALRCNHMLCKDCWTEYIEYNVTRPENLFFWKCPSQGCNLIVPESFNSRYVDKDKEELYDKKKAIAYADSSKSLRWCPAPDCRYGSEVENVAAKCVDCLCGWMYCFKCGLEDHRPCDCDIAKEWLLKDEGGGANAKWLLINTKDCPKCKKPIEKNQGCNYMRCRHPGCGFEFCWLCLADWKTHSDHFKCNKYDNLSKDEKSNIDNEEQQKRIDLQKYVFYYERYLNNAQAINSAIKILKTIKQEQKEIALKLSLTLTQLEFLEQASQVLKNAKRALKWSYAYGFYLTNDLQRNLYEIIQEKMDIYSSELHVLLEKTYITAKENIGDFTVFKDQVLASMFKCRQSSETFLEKMEEFETNMLEEELKLKMDADDSKDKTKKKATRKRAAKNANTADNAPDGHVKKSNKITKGK